MATYSGKMSDIVEEWAHENGTDIIDIDQASDWAVATGRYAKQPISAKQQCMQDMRRALQQATHIDPQGNKVRTKHAVKNWAFKGEQLTMATLWVDVRTGKPEMVGEAFQQGWKGIANDVKRHSIEKQSYDLNNAYGVILPMFNYDFNKQAEEARMSGEYDDNYDDDDPDDAVTA